MKASLGIDSFPYNHGINGGLAGFSGTRHEDPVQGNLKNSLFL